MKTIVYIVFVCCLFACTQKNEEPKNILNRQAFVNVLTDMFILDGEISFNISIDSATTQNNKIRYNSLLKKHNTDSAQVANTFAYYKDKNEELLEIYRVVMDSLNQRAAKNK